MCKVHVLSYYYGILNKNVYHLKPTYIYIVKYLLKGISCNSILLEFLCSSMQNLCNQHVL